MTTAARTLVAFLRLSRPLFLLGGVLLYALGALIARYQGHPLDLDVYVRGQLCVSALQLMTQYLNEYWDVETDRLNENRTPFSGGSGIFASGVLPRATALVAARVCMLAVVASALWLSVQDHVAWSALLLLALGFLGAYFYSCPPLTLASTGYGELTASLVVAGLLPALGYVLQARELSGLLLWISVPLIALHAAMLLAFEFPDLRSDALAGKRTLLVRVGLARGALVHHVLIGLALVGTLVGVLNGVPVAAGLASLVFTPAALVQIALVERLRRGAAVPYAWITFLGLLIFFLATSALAVAFWVLATPTAQP